MVTKSVKGDRRIGVLEIQGDFAAHEKTLAALGVDAVAVRAPKELEGLSGVILPGGESGAHLRILRENGLYDALRRFHRDGGAFFGTCAGMILLAKGVTGPAQDSLGLIDLDVIRNGYGRQIDSFEADAPPVPTLGGKEPLRLVFIRAPRVSRVGPGVTVLVEHHGEPVALHEGRVLVSSFHPEMTEDTRLHRYFLERVVDGVLSAR